MIRLKSYSKSLLKKLDNMLKNHRPKSVTHSIQDASIHENDDKCMKLKNIRKETPEERALRHPGGEKQAIMLCIALSLSFFSLISPALISFWLMFIALIIIVWLCWRLFRPFSPTDLQEIYCLNGTPKRWGLFGESHQNQMDNISLGVIDLIYPLHWRPYIVNDLDKKTDIDIYANRRVIRQGRYLSLHVEAKYFPLHGWRKNLILVMGSLLILIMLLFYAPLSLPLKLSINWIQGVQRHKVTDIETLAKIPLSVGDMLQIQGQGMCYVPPSSKQSHNFVFTPFDCSSIYWNKGLPLPQPESAVIEKAAALMSAVKQQLHPPMPSLQTRSDTNTTLPSAVTVEKPQMALAILLYTTSQE